MQLAAIGWSLDPEGINGVSKFVTQFVNASAWHHYVQLPPRRDCVNAAVYPQPVNQPLTLGFGAV